VIYSIHNVFISPHVQNFFEILSVESKISKDCKTQPRITVKC